MRLAIAVCVLLSFAEASAQTPCSAPDNLTRVDGNGKCLVLRTFSPAKRKHDVLAVWLHGDVSTGGPADYMNSYASEQAERYGITAVALIRPGYFDRNGNTSEGSDFGRRDNYTEENVDAISAAVARLKEHHGASKVFVVGHSGGAAIAGVILGRHPGVIDVASLFGCPCFLAASRPQWKASLSPIAFVSNVPKSSRVYAFTGARDDNISPSSAKLYVSALSVRGVPAEFHEMPRQAHNMDWAMVGFDRFVEIQNRELGHTN